MSIDLEAIRKKINTLSGKTKNKDVFWKPEENQNYVVRLLSFPKNNGAPFKELWFYYGIGNQTMLSLHQFGEYDPIQEMITHLKNEAANGKKDSYELAKKLFAKMRVYAPVIVRGEESKGVRLWAFGKEVYQKLLGFMLDDDYGDITDLQKGFDIKVNCTKVPGKQFASIDVIPRPGQRPLFTDEEAVKKAVESIPEPLDFFTKKTPDEMKKIVNDWLNSNPEEVKTEEKSETTVLESKTQEVKTEEKTTSRGGKKKQKEEVLDDIDDVFASLQDD